MKSVVEIAVSGLDSALQLQGPLIAGHIARLRQGQPEATPSEIVKSLEKHYLATVSVLGAAAGGAAALPVVGPGVAIAMAVGEIPAFLEATALFTLALAKVHGVEVQNMERRRTLILAVVLGNSGSAVVEKAAGRAGAHWGRSLVKAIPMEKITQINKILGRYFVTKYGTKQGVLVLGRALPFGFGAGIGAGGNAVLGYSSVRAARRAFGEPPTGFSETVHSHSELEPRQSTSTEGSRRAGDFQDPGIVSGLRAQAHRSRAM